MAYDKLRIAKNVSFSFKQGALSNSVLVTCPITGIVGTLNMPAIPISFTYSHPLASISNVRTLIKSCKDNDKNLASVLERQTMAGICLSLMHHNKLLAYEPGITATEKNLFLQSCGNILLEKAIKFLNYLSHTPFVDDHWKGIRKLPLYSFAWASSPDITALRMAESFLSYCKELRENIDPVKVETERMLNVPMDFIREKEHKDFQQTYQEASKRLRVIQNIKQEKRSLKEIKDQSKAIYADLEPFLSRELQAMCKLVIRNLHLGISADHANLLASKLFLLSNDDADRLAGLIKSAVSKHLSGEMGFFSDEVSPKPKRTIAEILAAKKAANSSIVVEVMPRNQEQEAEIESSSDEEFIVSDEKEDEEAVEDSFDLLTKPSSARSFKGEI